MLGIFGRLKRLEAEMDARISEIRYLSKMVDSQHGYPEVSVCTPYDEALAKLDEEFPGAVTKDKDLAKIFHADASKARIS